MFLFLKEKKLNIFFIFVLLLILIYVVNITSIPENIILFENEKINIPIMLGLRLEETVQVTTVLGERISQNIEDYFELDKKNENRYNISLLGVTLKTITTNIIPQTKVIPLGNLIGLKLNTKGVLVVGMSEIKGEDNKIYKPYENTGINQGDSIIEINDVQVNTTEELISCVSKCKGEKIEITYIKNGNKLETKITPVKTSNNTYQIGLWVRDAEAGIGTATFLDTQTKKIVALGHGIQDIDTEKLVDINSGELVTADIINIEKGKKESPGRIEGTIEESEKIGEIYSNTNFGIYGILQSNNILEIDDSKEIELASRKEIKQGKASIICTLENGIREEFQIEIQKKYINNNEDNKSMLVKVTDERLLEKTGGIIQGMSGSPIIQDGKLIGALTHVLVSDPTKGYAVFADMMVKEMRLSQ